MEILDRKLHAMCLDGFVAFHHIENILFHIFFHHIPGTTTEAKSLALADSVEPMALMLTQHLTRFNINDITWLFAQEAPDVVVVVDLAQEADALRILTAGIHKVFSFGNGTHLFLPHVTDGEQRLLQLPVVELRKEVGLVLHGIRTRAEPLPAFFVNLRLGIMSCSDEVVVMTTLTVEGTELNHPVAHHIGIGCATFTHSIHRIARHLVPIVAMAVHHL